MEHLPDPHEAGELLTKASEYLELKALISKHLGEYVANFFSKKKLETESKKAKQLAQDNLSESILKKSVDQFAETVEGKHVLNVIGASVVYTELKKFDNLSNVIDTAFDQLSQEEANDSNKVVDDDWATRFFSYAGEVSNEEMQLLWGRVLAGEVQKPGAYSKRTLTALRDMAKFEAETFKKVAQLATKSDYFNFPSFILGNSNDYNDCLNGVSYGQLALLEEVGLLRMNSITSTIKGFVNENDTTFFFYCGSHMLKFNVEGHVPERKILTMRFTFVGEELLSLVDKALTKEVILQIRNSLAGPEQSVVCSIAGPYKSTSELPKSDPEFKLYDLDS